MGKNENKRIKKKKRDILLRSTSLHQNTELDKEKNSVASKWVASWSGDCYGNLCYAQLPYQQQWMVARIGWSIGHLILKLQRAWGFFLLLLFLKQQISQSHTHVLHKITSRKAFKGSGPQNKKLIIKKNTVNIITYNSYAMFVFSFFYIYLYF